MAFNNTARPGLRTTQTVNPQDVLPDIQEKIHTLAPESMPLITLLEKFGKGPDPKSKKVEVRKYYEFDPLDTVTALTVGITGNTETRFARLSLAQASRPLTNSTMYYQPQDKFYIVETGQTVEVVMTPDAAFQTQAGSDITLSTALTGNTTTRSAAGTVVVRVVEPVDFISFTAPGSVIYLGRTIWESQDIQATPAQRDVIYDYNFVEHKEKVIECTEDQMDFIQRRGTIDDFSFQQKEMIKEFKSEINHTSFFSERSVNYDIPNRPTYHMRGAIPAIRTNVQVYNPAVTTDFEQLTSTFMLRQAFRYQGKPRKMAFAGVGFLNNFNNAFREYRRSDINVAKQTPGLSITTYEWNNRLIDMVHCEVFRMGTDMENWLMVVDPQQAEYRVKRNFVTRPYSLPTQRLNNLMVEWQGTIAFHLEEHMALLRTA